MLIRTMLLAGTAVALAFPALAQECATEPVTVGLVPKLDTDPYFQVAREGAEEAAAEVGGAVIQAAPSQATAEAQIEFINAMIAQQVGVIAIAGNDANAVAPALQRARQEGIHVIAYDSDVAAGARTVFVNQVKGESLAEMMLVSMHDLIGGSGQFAILSSTPTAANQNAWIEIMQGMIANDPTYADMELVQVAYGEESEQVNQQQALALAQAFPDLKGIIVPAGIGLPAASRALSEAGLIDRVKLTGLAPATLMRSYIDAGQAQDIWWNVTDLGYLTYMAAQAVAQCQITGAEGETFSAGRLGEYTIGAAGEVVLGPADIVTPENVANFKF